MIALEHGTSSFFISFISVSSHLLISVSYVSHSVCLLLINNMSSFKEATVCFNIESSVAVEELLCVFPDCDEGAADDGFRYKSSTELYRFFAERNSHEQIFRTVHFSAVLKKSRGTVI